MIYSYFSTYIFFQLFLPTTHPNFFLFRSFDIFYFPSQPHNIISSIYSYSTIHTSSSLPFHLNIIPSLFFLPFCCLFLYVRPTHTLFLSLPITEHLSLSIITFSCCSLLFSFPFRVHNILFYPFSFTHIFLPSNHTPQYIFFLPTIQHSFFFPTTHDNFLFSCGREPYIPFLPNTHRNYFLSH